MNSMNETHQLINKEKTSCKQSVIQLEQGMFVIFADDWVIFAGIPNKQTKKCIKQQNVFVVHKCGETKCTAVVRMKFYSIGMQSKQTIFQLFTFPRYFENWFHRNQKYTFIRLIFSTGRISVWTRKFRVCILLLLGKQFNCILSF